MVGDESWGRAYGMGGAHKICNYSVYYTYDIIMCLQLVELKDWRLVMHA